MYILTVDTPSFSFMSAGTHQRQAIKAFRAAWKVHQKSTGATMTASEVLQDASIIFVGAGDCVRDGEDRLVSDVQI